MWEETAATAGMGLINNASNLAFGKAIQRQNLKGQKKALEQQNAAQMDIWNKTNYGPQVEQMKKAGINPGLLYGMGGQGGQTGAGTANTSGAGEPEKIMDMQSIAQMRLLEAQAKNLDADTADKLRKAGESPAGKVDIENVQAGTENLKATKTKTEAETALVKLNTGLAEIEKEYQGRTLEDRISAVDTQLVTMTNELKVLENEVDVSNETKATRIAQVKADYAITLLQGEAIAQGIRLSRAQIRKIDAEITTMFKDAETNRLNATTNMENKNTNASRLQWDITMNNVSEEMQMTVGVVQSIIQAIGLGGIIQKTMTPGRTPIGYK